MIGLGRWVFETLRNVIEPLVKDINKILDRVGNDDIQKVVDKVLNLELKRIYINSILYLLITIIVCSTLVIYGYR